MAKGYPDPSVKWCSTYKYTIKSTFQVESRKSYIKNMRAAALYMEEEVTDKEFHEMALGRKRLPRLDTFKIHGVAEI